MSLPVCDTTFQVLQCCDVLSPTLFFIDSVGDTLGNGNARSKIIHMSKFGDILEHLYQTLYVAESITALELDVKLLTSSNRGYLQIRCTGLIRKAGSSDLTLRMSFRDYENIFGEITIYGTAHVTPSEHTHRKILFLCEHNLTSVGVVGTIGLVNGKFVLLLLRAGRSIPAYTISVRNNAKTRYPVSKRFENKNAELRTNSVKAEPHNRSFQGRSQRLSSLIKNRRWKLTSLLRFGKRRWIVP